MSTMREKCEKAMFLNLENSWKAILQDFADGKEHTAQEIANRTGCTVGEVSANLVCWRDNGSRIEGLNKKVTSRAKSIRFAQIDDSGRLVKGGKVIKGGQINLYKITL